MPRRPRARSCRSLRWVDKLFALDGVHSVACFDVGIKSMGMRYEMCLWSQSLLWEQEANSRFVLNQAVKIFDGVVNDFTVQVETVRDEMGQGATLKTGWMICFKLLLC